MNNKHYRGQLVILLTLATLILSLPALHLGCGGDDTPLVFAASNDLEGSGILWAWVEVFQSRTGMRVELVVAPDRQAFAMARHGECDLILTSYGGDMEDLEEYGYLEGGREVMRSDYVLLGPPDDPAGTRDMGSAAEAFTKIAETTQNFVLRVDGSGTASRQDYLWSLSGAVMAGEWLLPTEADTEDALREASREKAYTLADRSTYERLAGELDLEVLLQEDEELALSYYAAAVSVFTYPDTDLDGALEFIDYLLSEDARAFLSMGAWSPPE